MKCPKCNNEMESGGLFKPTPYPGIIVWGIKFTGFFPKIQNKHEVVTNRCNNCGYLESYAK